MTSAWGTPGGLMMRGVNWAVTRAAPDASRGRRGRGLSGLPGLCIRCRVPIPASSCATARGGHFLGTGRLKTGQRANGSGLDPAVEGAVILGPAAPSLRPRRRGPRWYPCRWPRPGAPSPAGVPHRAPARRQGLRADTGSCRGAVARPGYAPTPAQPCAEGIQDLLAPHGQPLRPGTPVRSITEASAPRPSPAGQAYQASIVQREPAPAVRARAAAMATSPRRHRHRAAPQPLPLVSGQRARRTPPLQLRCRRGHAERRQTLEQPLAPCFSWCLTTALAPRRLLRLASWYADRP